MEAIQDRSWPHKSFKHTKNNLTQVSTTTYERSKSEEIKLERNVFLIN